MGTRRVPGMASIVVTSYNREKYIIECMKSLVDQTYPHIEIIVVDDGSTDGTIESAKGYAARAEALRPALKDRIIVLGLPRNVGYAGPLTMGMFLAEGEFIAVQDSDDLSHPDRIKKQVEYLRGHPDTGLVGTQYADFFKGAPRKMERPANWIRYGDDILKTYRNGGHCICHGTILMRGFIFDRLGGYNRRLGKKADYEFLSRCVLGGIKAANIPEVLYYYRRHSSQMSN